jgi:hypothetical protein
MASRIQIRRDSLSNWTANNPVLSSGEIAFVLDENKFKVGNGSSAFTNLPYLDSREAEKLKTSRVIELSGDVSGSVTFDGSASAGISTTLSNSGVSASTYGSSSQIPIIAVDSKGRITSASVASVEGLPSQTENNGKYLTTNGEIASWDTINLGTDTDGEYVARLSASGEGLSLTGSGESASVTISNTGVTSLAGTASQIAVSSSAGSVTLSLPATINVNTSGNAATATKLATARAITLTGDVTGTANFDGSASAGISATLANSGVSASTYGSSTAVPVITVDAKGRITSASVQSIVSLPNQTGQSGKYLTTNGTVASWQDPFSGNPTFSGDPIFTGQPTFTGGIRVQEMIEDIVGVSPTSNAYTLDYTTGNIFYSTGSLTGNFTANITNAPTTNDRVFTINHIITQGATGYRLGTLNINGSGVTIKWAGGVVPTPTSSNGKLDIFTYTIIRRGGSFEALVSANLNF